MIYFAVFAIALVITMALIPPLIQVADKVGLVDMPGERKVHTASVPRVGGIGMILGVIIPILFWVETDTAIISFLAGIGVIFIFGIWDDRGDLDYRLKFLGQIIAACIVVIYGDITIKIVPFFGFDPVSPWLYYPFTVIVLVAVTNAINLADGLDGLAAGVVMLSLAGVAILAYIVDAGDLLLIVLAITGSVAGFLRFNTYPARIFMGDTGSQFLGFSAGVLMIMLTQQASTALNPAVPLLLLGLPLFDTMFVMVRRIYYGKSPFSPDKNHIHHQLLALNLDHYEAVIIIYFIQAVLVSIGILFRFQNDLHVVASWVLLNISMAIILVVVGRAGWRAHDGRSRSVLARLVGSGYKHKLFKASQFLMHACVGALLIVGPVLFTNVDPELGIMMAVMGFLLLLRMLFGNKLWFINLRFTLYIAIAGVVYLSDQWLAGQDSSWFVYDYLYYGIIALGLVASARYRIEDAFKTTPTDYLVLLLVIGSFLVPQLYTGDEEFIPLPVKLIVMFYAVEMLLHHMSSRWSFMTLSALWAFALISIKSLGIF